MVRSNWPNCPKAQVEEVKTRVLRDQLGEKIAALAGADFNRPMPGESGRRWPMKTADAPRGKKPFKPAGKSGLIADRKGRRVLVQRTGSEEARARNELEANGYGPPRRPQRGYHGKRDPEAAGRVGADLRCASSADD